MGKYADYVIIGILIAIVWGLLLLPIIFYHLPVHFLEPISSNSTGVRWIINENFSNETCSAPVVYNGTVCRDALQKFSSCLPGNGQNSAILLSQDRMGIQDEVEHRIKSLELFADSKKCAELEIPFMCVYYFGTMCDSTGRPYQLSKKQCLKLSQGVCKKEWELAANYVPDCNSNAFSETELTTCPINTEEYSGAQVKKVTISNSSCTLNCSENFYCRPDAHSCVPKCSWREYPEPADTIINVCSIIGSSLGVLFGVLTLLSAALRWKRVCSFPSVIVIYQTVAAMIIALLVLIGFMNPKALYCWPSNDLEESVKHSTPFCVLSGILSHYLLVFLSLWWIVHISVIFWKLQFPFHARNLEIEKKIKYVHMASMILVFLLSGVPIAIIMLVDWRERVAGSNVMGTLGFGKTRFFPIVCTAMSQNSVYYSIVLPINIIVPVGATLLIIIIWHIHKNYKADKEAKEKQKIKISSAELKVMFVLVYYVLMAVVALTGLIVISWKSRAFIQELFRYFLCQRPGYNPNQPCHRTKLDELHQGGLVAISFIFISLFPAVNFIFTTNFSEMMALLCGKQYRQKQNGSKETLSLIQKSPIRSLKNLDTGYSTD